MRLGTVMPRATMVVEFGEEYPEIELPYGTVTKDEG